MAEGAGPLAGGSLPALGPHGEGWAALQAALMGLAVAGGLRGPAWPACGRRLRLGAAGLLAAGGAALLGAGGGRLGRQLTPLPRPTEQNELRRDGVYGLARHPMYGGGILLAAGWGLATSPLALAAALLLGPFFEVKRRREEAWLAERHSDYDEYRRAVRRRFVPLVW